MNSMHTSFYPSGKSARIVALTMAMLANVILAQAQTIVAGGPLTNTPAGPPIAPSSWDWLVPIALFAAIFGFAVLVALYKLRQSRLMHETLRLTIEKGQPIPPDLLRFGQPRSSANRDLRYGLVCIALGLGLAGFGWGSHEAHWTVGLIPFLIGWAFLITSKLESNRNGRS